MRADVVVVTWNGRAVLDTCLAHLARQSEPHRLIVVDNASEDGTVAHVRERWPEATVVEMPRNVGFGAGVNAGVAAGDGEVVVLVNNDVEADPEMLERLLAPLCERGAEDVGMVAAMTLLPGRERVDTFGVELDRGLCAYNRLRNGSPDGSPGPLLGPNGAVAAYRRAAFEQVGGFDERLFAYGEETDLALRIRSAGWRAAAAPDARGVHLGGASFGVDSPLQQYLAGFARGFLVRRWGILRSRGALHAIAIDALVVGWGIARHRSLRQLRGRVDGWRAAGRGSRPLPPGVVDESVGLPEAIHRLRAMR
jgi:GT2 family glycosyltransferase